MVAKSPNHKSIYKEKEKKQAWKSLWLPEMFMTVIKEKCMPNEVNS